jgi:hypothetical protein
MSKHTSIILNPIRIGSLQTLLSENKQKRPQTFKSAVSFLSAYRQQLETQELERQNIFLYGDNVYVCCDLRILFPLYVDMTAANILEIQANYAILARRARSQFNTIYSRFKAFMQSNDSSQYGYSITRFERRRGIYSTSPTYDPIRLTSNAAVVYMTLYPDIDTPTVRFRADLGTDLDRLFAEIKANSVTSSDWPAMCSPSVVPDLVAAMQQEDHA